MERLREIKGQAMAECSSPGTSVEARKPFLLGVIDRLADSIANVEDMVAQILKNLEIPQPEILSGGTQLIEKAEKDPVESLTILVRKTALNTMTARLNRLYDDLAQINKNIQEI